MAGADAVRGIAHAHALLYVENVDEVIASSFVQSRFVNPDALQPGFNLARFECGAANAPYDRMRVVDNDALTITAYDPDDRTDHCNDVF